MEDNVIRQNITETLENNYMPYAMSVIVSRALPEIDGFKPSHRKLLYTMYKMNLLKSNRTKSANIVGQTMKLNPHGDGAIYETMVRLTKGYSALNTPFVDSKGNFGKVYSRDMAYAASRYTEAKLSDICIELFRDIEENAVDYIDNYDSTMKEPVLLPVTFPNILVNPNQGIAVGMASNICSFNLKEICDATINYLKNEKTEMSKYIVAPDFPTGGSILYNEEEMREILNTGRGSFKVRSKYTYVKKENCIEVTEIPYTTTVEAIIDKIEDLVKTGKVKEISDVRDETDLSGLKLTIDLKRNTDADVLMEKLFKLTTLQDSFSCNFNVLIEGKPKVMGVKEIIANWCLFRQQCIIRKYTYAIEKMEKKHHLLLGLKQILLDIDKAIEIIRNTEKEKEVVPNLMLTFNISEMQAEYVAEIKLRHLNKQYILNTLKELEVLENEITKLKDIIGSEVKVKKVIIDELKQTQKKYAKERVTDILNYAEITAPTQEAFIEDYNVRLFFTDHQYLKKITLVSLRSSGEQKIKDDDTIIQELDSSNKSDLLLFSNKCNVYKLKLHEIEDTKASQFGVYLPNLLDLEENEQIIAIHTTIDYSGYMLFAYDTGKIAKVPVLAYETKTNRKKLIKAYYSKAKCIGITHVVEEDYIRLIREDGKCAVVPVKLIDEKVKRDSNGVQVLNITKKIGMNRIERLQEVTEDNILAAAKSIPVSGKQI
ncbi:DNA gyrase/topoisomerase IV subunit A [Cellulosilyticum sp. I15G10I2]|uniref:DNA gyrase/topoisomerase IV subunit A n=1 Tax=Cellulosilyticum sp. I15G10I2 TaxID=1892843 RepID=UPI00085CC813|nr:DNA topoisomerase (ATP-hydrolyzing) subunit A [Cellulosilyticum sp. I15G10I2]